MFSLRLFSLFLILKPKIAFLTSGILKPSTDKISYRIQGQNEGQNQAWQVLSHKHKHEHASLPFHPQEWLHLPSPALKIPKNIAQRLNQEYNFKLPVSLNLPGFNMESRAFRKTASLQLKLYEEILV